MRILWVASRLEGRGGIGRVLVAGTRALVERGHDVHLAGPLASDEVERFGELPMTFFPRRGARIAQLVDLFPLVATFRPDVVHFHAAGVHVEPIAALRLRRAGGERPLLVATPHSSRPFAKRRARLGLRAADLVLAPSEWSGAQARDGGARRVAVVHAGVDLGPAPELGAREPIVLALGRLEPVKGFDVLLDAFARASATRPAWRLWIAGEGSEGTALERRADALGCRDRVRFLGWIQGDDKRDALARAAIGALPSRRESFGAALLEMQERGLACVASDVGGVADLADGGRAARLVPPGDATALADALASLFDDAAARRALAENARRHAEPFRWSAVAARYEAAYTDGLSRLR
jgi:glycosyltransferase involved in cell wall biosynthesis